MSAGHPRPPSTRRATPGAEGILAAALDCFYEQGYGGTPVREIATNAEVTVAALYHHFESKHAILETLLTRNMQAFVTDMQNAYHAADANPVNQLDALVRAHVLYNATHQTVAFVGNSELRSLEPDAHRRVVALRDTVEALFIKP